MSFVDFKEVTAPTTGSTVKYGSQDILDIMQIFNGKTVATRRPHIVNPWRFDSSIDFKEISAPSNPPSGYQTLYVDSSTHKPSWKNSSGLIYDVTTAIPWTKRWGEWQPTAANSAAVATAVGVLDGILTSMTPTGPGATNSTTYDTSEGIIMNLTTTTTTNQNMGLVSSAAGVGMGRRLFGMRAVMRGKVNTVAGGVSRLYFGFTSATALPTSDTPLATGDHGVIVGFKSTATNYEIYHNDGATSVTTDTVSTGIAKDTSYHTIEINWVGGGSSINVVFDGVSQAISTDLPATTQNLFFNCVFQNATAAIRTASFDYVYIEAEK